jgi:ribonuclease HI
MRAFVLTTRLPHNSSVPVRVEWADMNDVEWRQEQLVITCKRNGQLFLKRANAHAATDPVVLHVPPTFETDIMPAHRLIKSITLIAGGNIPEPRGRVETDKIIPPTLTMGVNVRLDDVTFVIYADGSAMQATVHGHSCGHGPAGSAIVTINRRTGEYEAASWHNPWQSNNVAEWNAFVAARRRATALARAGEMVLIIIDSQIVYDAWCKAKAPTKQHLLRFYNTTKHEHEAGLDGRIIVTHMRRELNNKADEHAKAAARSAQGCGDQALFLTVDPDYQSMPHTRNFETFGRDDMATTVHQTVTQIAESIASFEQFARVRQFRVRSHVPPQAAAHWAQIVKLQLQLVIGAQNIEQRSIAIIGFLLLPTVYLPTNMQTRRLVQRLHEGAPARINLNTARERRPPPADEKARLQAKAARVTAQLRDFRVSGAVKEMLADAAADDESEEMRNATPERRAEILQQRHNSAVGKLRTKFPPLDERHPVALQRDDVPDVAPFSESLVWNVVRSMSRKAASAIDGWSRQQLMSAMELERSISDDLGSILAWVEMAKSTNESGPRYFNELAMEIIRGGRLVSVPKPPNDVRPIGISSFIAKLAGACGQRRDNVKRLPFQFAIRCPNGTQQIVHRVRKAYNDGKCIIKLDLRNAYNTARRGRILAALRENYADCHDLRAYFATMYGVPSKLAVYGPGGVIDVVEAAEGVRQGDAPSSFYFCAAINVGERITERFGHERASVMMYMDDTTIIADAEIAEEVARFAAECFNDIGFDTNRDKSSMVCRTGTARMAGADGAVGSFIKVVHHEAEEFKVLGAIVNSSYATLYETLRKRITKFFDTLEALPLLAEDMHTIVTYCGRPKLIYLCATTPPEFARPIVEFFQERLNRAFAKIIDVNATEIPKELLHHVDGAAIPNYTDKHEQLYVASEQMALRAEDKATRIRLTEVAPIVGAFSPAESPMAYAWSRYQSACEYDRLPNVTYHVALALRVNMVPRNLSAQFCARYCHTHGKMLQTVPELIEHALHCESLTGVTGTARHNLMRDAMAAVARRYGVNVISEPRCYVYLSSVSHQRCDVQRRPDLRFKPPLSDHCVATDLTIVTPDGAPGAAALRAAEEKRQRHSAAVHEHGDIFIPFAAETNGYFANCCDTLINKLADGIPRELRFAFRRDFIGACASSIARFRAEAVMNAIRAAPMITNTHTDL